MSWINEHKRVWRVAILVVVLVAIMGPWVVELINVPSEYPCSALINSMPSEYPYSAPGFRLEGDFCGVPMSGIRMFSWVIVAFTTFGVGLVTGAMGFADRGFLSTFIFIIVLPLLLVPPIFSTLLLIVRGDRRRLQVFNAAAWGLAAGIGLLLGVFRVATLGIGLLGMSSYLKLLWTLWGIRLYIGLAVSALILEVLALAAGRRPSQGR